MIQALGSRVLTIHSEKFISNPREELLRICRFLNIICSDDYLKSCVSIVYKTPSKTRKTILWNPNAKMIIHKEIERIPFYKNYVFDE